MTREQELRYDVEWLRARINELQHFLDTQGAENERLWAALETIADIAEGSRTLNSFPNIATIARIALDPNYSKAATARS